MGMGSESGVGCRTMTAKMLRDTVVLYCLRSWKVLIYPAKVGYLPMVNTTKTAEPTSISSVYLGNSQNFSGISFRLVPSKTGTDRRMRKRMMGR